MQIKTAFPFVTNTHSQFNWLTDEIILVTGNWDWVELSFSSLIIYYNFHLLTMDFIGC